MSGAGPGRAPPAADVRGAARRPRVASTRAARLGVWAAIALGLLLWNRGGEGAAAWQIGAGARGCELQLAGLAAPCPCAQWPARLRLLLQEPIPLEGASAEELEALPGVGPALAAAIARDRLERGPFERIEDLARVPGIGPATLERLRPLLRAGAPACPGPPGPAARPSPSGVGE